MRLTALSPWRYCLLVGGAVVLLVLIGYKAVERYF
jgi:purine-cytosine permease-like protein